MSTFVDHLVVAAATLDAGVAWCEATLGVTPAPGGRHPLFGTHNCLLRIDTPAFPEAYLEIIAVDPQAEPPQRPRWFNLDDPATTAGGPRLVHVVARSTLLDMHRWGLITVGLAPGDPVAAARETPAGTLRWEIVVRPDGRLLAGGALPSLIRWHGPHPGAALPACGVSLRSLQLAGVPPRARDVLRLRGVTHAQAGADAEGGAAAPLPALLAVLDTPAGPVTLRSG